MPIQVIVKQDFLLLQVFIVNEQENNEYQRQTISVDQNCLPSIRLVLTLLQKPGYTTRNTRHTCFVGNKLINRKNIRNMQVNAV